MNSENLKMIKPTKSRGFSLLSLMIAMVIGLFIIAAAGEVYLKSKSSFNARAAVSAVSENGRFAIQDLRRTLAMAGMNVTASEEFSDTLRSIAPLNSVNGTVQGTTDEASDIVAIRYRRGPTCYGTGSSDSYINLPLSSAPATIRFSVVNDQLMCEKVGSDARALVSGIKLMKVLYGVDDTDDGYANRYLTANQIELETIAPDSKWRDIVSIRVGLVVDSAEQSQPLDMRSKTAQTLSLLGMDYDVLANDEKLYKVFTTTVQLRNLNAIMQKQ